MEEEKMTRREIVKAGLGITGILVSGKAPAYIRGLVAAQQTSLVGELIKYTAKDYVQDGLVAIWDGIENAGYGIHDAATRSLVDLCGNPDFEMFLKHDSIELGDNYVCIPTNFSGTSYPISTRTEQSLSDVTRTVEFCVSDFTGRGEIGDTVIYELGLNNRVGFQYGAAYAIQTGIQASSRACFNAIPWGKENGSYSFIYNESINTCTGVYKDGQQIDNTTGRTINNPNFGGGVMKIGCRNYYGSPRGVATGVKIHSLRVYSRVLSATEVAQNNRIDRKRFGI